MTFEIAKRKAVPLIIALAGTSGSGKTYSALLMAAGLAGKDGKVGFIDTELGRGSMYADDPDIIKAMPGGQFYISDLREPFSPGNYTKAIKEAIQNKVSVLVIDSMTHEWDGFGGCRDIAENNKLGGLPNWMLAKTHHKRLMNLLTQCPMHIIFCLRAQEKDKPETYIEEGSGRKKTRFTKLGLQPIQEKNFMYEMTLSMLLKDTSPGKPEITKCPKPLLYLFSGDNPIITKEIGGKLLDWSNGGEAVNVQLRELKRKCRERAMLGTASLDQFFLGMEPKDKALLKQLSDDSFKIEVREIAKNFDLQQLSQDEEKDEQEPKGLDLLTD